MLEENTLIEVENRDNGTVGYTIPDLGNLHRNFQSGEVKKITMNELRKLSYVPGGNVILKDYLVIHNAEAVAELIGVVEPEYNYTKADVELLLSKGTMDQFMDCLDFAPEGVVELVKDLAVKMEINDIAKREAIKAKTGLDVTKAIEINHETEKVEESEEKHRRSVPVSANTNATTTRRTNVPNYKIIK